MPESLTTRQNAYRGLRIVPLSSESCADWDHFCQESDDAWFWHTTSWLNYTLNYRPELQPRSQSFLCLNGAQVVTICPLLLETHQIGGAAVGEFSFGGDAGPAPAFANALSEKVRKAATRAVFSYVDSLAEKMDVQRVSFRMSPPAPSFWTSGIPQPNPLVRLGFSDISMSTQVIDLSADEQQLLRSMRKGHRADIARAGKLMQSRVLDRDTITPEAFERYRLLHHKAAGRVTRPLETFHMMHAWIRQGLAVLASASLDGRDVGFALVSVFKDGAYYSSSCEDPEFNHLPIGHILQWKAIQWLKSHGVRRYEIGMQLYGPQPNAAASEKELRIAFFKRGFGGVAVPLWRGEKFYSREYYLRIAGQRMEQYATSLERTAPTTISTKTGN